MCALPLKLLFSGTRTRSHSVVPPFLVVGRALLGGKKNKFRAVGTIWHRSIPRHGCVSDGGRDSVWARAPAHSLHPDCQFVICGRQKARHCADRCRLRTLCHLPTHRPCLPRVRYVGVQTVPRGFLPAPLFATGARERDWTVRCVYSACVAGVRAAPLFSCLYFLSSSC